MKTTHFAIRNLSIAALALAVNVPSLFAQGTAFTYQGRLNDGANPASGSYDLRFYLRDALDMGNPVGTTNTLAPVTVTNGLFTVTLDFGAGIFTGPPRWLEIGVRTNGSVAAYSTLGPRQSLTPTPYAIYAASSGAGGSGIWTLNGTNAYYNAGNVGIGTATPANKLTLVTPTSSYGFEHTDGNIRLGTYAGGSTFGGWLGTISYHPLSFFVNDGPASMTIAPTGNVGIGTPNSGAGGQFALLIQSRAGVRPAFGVQDSSATPVFQLYTGPNELLMFGQASKSEGGTSWGTLSDRRLKQNVRVYEPGLIEVLQLRPVRFRYRDDPQRGLTSAQEEVGFIAQEVREVIPDAVAEGKDGYLSLKADPIHWAAINALQELDAKLEAQNRAHSARSRKLEAENAMLKQKNAELESRLGALEKLMNHLSVAQGGTK